MINKSKVLVHLKMYVISITMVRLTVYYNKCDYYNLCLFHVFGLSSCIFILCYSLTHRYLELESSGHRNEVRLHYRSGSHRSQTEVFPYILADDKWHRFSLAISASHLVLHVDCNK